MYFLDAEQFFQLFSPFEINYKDSDHLNEITSAVCFLIRLLATPQCSGDLQVARINFQSGFRRKIIEETRLLGNIS